MAPTLAQTLAVHRSQLGITEPGRGKAPQVTKYNEWYAKWSGQPGYRDTYWCATYQSWVLSVAGFSIAEAGRFGNCNPWIRWLKAHGMWSRTPRPGALVFLDWDGDGFAEHIGMVESVGSGGRVVTLEGNASVEGARDGVYRMVRRTGILGYGYLPYRAEPAKVAPGRSTKKLSVSMTLPGPVVIGQGAGKAPWTVDARYKRWQECPAMPVGFGGPEDRAQRLWAAYWFALVARWSPGYFKQITASVAGRREVARQEIGPVTVATAEKMLRQVQKTYSFRGVVPPVAWSIYQP